MQPTQNTIAIPATTDPDVAQTLRDTALYLNRHGWNQGEYYDARNGLFTPPACLVGAIGMVCYGGPVDAPALNYDDPGFGAFEAAVRYLNAFLRLRHGLAMDAYAFNDTRGRTLDEVLAVLDTAAGFDLRAHVPWHCGRFMQPDIDVQVDCLALPEAERFVSAWHVCPECGYTATVEVTDPAARKLAVDGYRDLAEIAVHDDPKHTPGTSDACEACDLYCYCTAESACINHVEDDTDTAGTAMGGAE
ncbi:hypothetical protein KZZ52_49970 [Dactylosporangium sp. AC04546]|uniref:DUF6197 family protein n=1 Tax=Dactylosporangium sp. AC04546 TaxID=2862460 RepID=UPI001EDE294C|nr:hypothetical protein [Dactylosporangium sp. AC04546]WVK82013.1 hypothetical protein KZZ52_49970 [Dactylosporangium sp. AC04546]